MPLHDITFLDDSTRPRGEKLTGLTPAQKAPGQHLRMIHDHLRENMGVIKTLLDEIEAGEADAAEVREKTDALPMLGNYRRFRSLCGQHCQIVNMHHSIEDAAVFPELGTKSQALARVAARLIAEHEVVHELLVRLVAALNALAAAPDAEKFADARELYDALERVLLSHLGYEEEEIGDALGYYRIGV